MLLLCFGTFFHRCCFSEGKLYKKFVDARREKLLKKEQIFREAKEKEKASKRLVYLYLENFSLEKFGFQKVLELSIFKVGNSEPSDGVLKFLNEYSIALEMNEKFEYHSDNRAAATTGLSSSNLASPYAP